MIFNDITKWDKIARFLVEEQEKEKALLFCDKAIGNFQSVINTIKDDETREAWETCKANWEGIKNSICYVKEE